MHEEGICLIKKDFKCPQINRETKIYNALGFVSQKNKSVLKWFGNVYYVPKMDDINSIKRMYFFFFRKSLHKK